MTTELSQHYQEINEINEIEILQFERGNTPDEMEHERGFVSEPDTKNHRNYGRGNLRSQSPKKLRPMNTLPDYHDSIGRGFGNLNPQVIQLAREMGGGIISRFAFFQNVFRPDVYEKNDVTEKDNRQRDPIKRLDHHLQVEELCQLDGKECYPTMKTSLMEQELENFSKQIVASLNAVLYKSSTSQTAVWPAIHGIDLHTIVSMADASKSTLSNNSSLGNKPLSSPSNNFNGDKSRLYKQISKMEGKMEQLKQQMETKDALFNKARKDYTRDLQNLRNALYLCNNPLNRQHAEAVKLAVNVFNFNDLEGLSPEISDFFNEKMQIVKEEAQMQIDRVTQNVTHLYDRIEKYKELKPAMYGLMDMDLKEIFEGTAIIETLAFPIWQALMAAFPPGHFSAIIKQIAESLTDDNDDTYDKMIRMVQDGIDKNQKQCERAVDIVRGRNKVYMDEITDLKQQLDAGEWRFKDLLAKQEQQSKETHQELMRAELDKLKQQYGTEMKKQEVKIRMQKDDITRLKRGKESNDMKMALFKWRQSGLLARFVLQLEVDGLDMNTLKDTMLEDIRKLFSSQELSQLTNSLKQSKQLQKQAESQLKALQSDNYQLRLKVNKMLTDNQSINWQLERIRSREIYFYKIIETEKKKKNDAILDLDRSKEKVENLSKILERQIKLKEMFEDKLKDTLDMKSSSMGFSQSNMDRSRQALRQKQTKRVVAGFQIEMDSAMQINQEAVNKLTDKGLDVNHGMRAIDQSCQTEVQGVSKTIDLVIVYDKAVNRQSTSLPMSEQGIQTNISGTVIDFLANGSKKYENVVKNGLIKGSALMQVEDSEAQDYISRLYDQESSEGLVSIQRPRLGATQKRSDLVSPESSVERLSRNDRGVKQNRNQSTKVVISPKGLSPGSGSYMRNATFTKRFETAMDLGKDKYKAAEKLGDSIASGFDSRAEVKEEDSMAASSDYAATTKHSVKVKNRQPERERTREREQKARASAKKATRVTKRITKGSKISSVTPLQRSDMDLPDAYPKRLKPKLHKQNTSRRNADLSSSTSELGQSSDGEQNSSHSVSNPTETLNTLDLRPQTDVRVKKSEPNIQMHMMDQDYHSIAQRKNAVSQFEAYMQVFELMIKLEPKVFKTAVRAIKKHRSFKLDLRTIKRLKKLYPDLLPPVFQRLLFNEPDAKERLLQRQILIDASQAWRNKLIDRGLIDETQEVPSTVLAPFTNDLVSGHISPYTILTPDEIKASGNSDTQRTQNTSVPYLSPVNFGMMSETNSLNSMTALQKYELQMIENSVQQQQLQQQLNQQQILQLQHQPQISKSPNQATIIESKIQQASEEDKSAESSETVNHINIREIEPTDGGPSPVHPHQLTQGFYSLPNSAYEMRVSIMLPDNKRKAGSRSSLQAGRSRKARMAKQHATEQQSWHLMVGRNKSQSLTKPSRMPRNAEINNNKSQRFAKQVNESGVLDRTSLVMHTQKYSQLSNQEGDIVIMQAPDVTSGGRSSTLQLNTLVAQLAGDSNVNDYDAARTNTIQLGERNLPSQVELSRRFTKRPVTCRLGAANKKTGKTRNTLNNSTAVNKQSSASSQMQQLFKQGMVNSSTLAQTIATTRAMSHMDHTQAGKITALSTNFDKRGVSTSQVMSGHIITDKSINSFSHTNNKQSGAQTGACPVKAFDMSNIPISPKDWQIKHRFSKMNSPLNRIIAGKTVSRAQSATQNRNFKTLNPTQSAQGNMQAALNTMNKNSKRKVVPINKVAIKVSQRINVNSEDELEHLTNQAMQYVDNGGPTRTLLQSHINQRERVSQVTMLGVSEMELPQGKNSELSNNQDIQLARVEREHHPSQQRPGLIKVSDQLDGRFTHQAQYVNRL